MLGFGEKNGKRKVASSYPTDSSAGLRDPTLFRDSQRPWGQTRIDGNDEHRVGEAVASKVAQSWPWDSQIADKKTTLLLKKNHSTPI